MEILKGLLIYRRLLFFLDLQELMFLLLESKRDMDFSLNNKINGYFEIILRLL